MGNNYLARTNFGDETADDAPLDDLMAYFVKQNSFEQFKDFQKRFLVVRARKGNGKSAILQWVYHSSLKNKSNIVVKCRGSELANISVGNNASDNNPNSRIHEWMSKICTLINRSLAQKITFAFSDQKMSIIEAAEIDGMKQCNFIGGLLKRFDVKYLKEKPSKAIKNEIETLKREKKLQAVVIIDDLDATFQNTQEECINLSTFFSACRYLIQDFPGIVIRTSIRTDVWPIIRPLDESLDKVEQYMVDLYWNEYNFRTILEKRIKYSLNLENEKNALDRVFASTLNWGKKEVKNYVCLYTLAYGRPRWGIQLCKLSQDIALTNDHDKITQRDIEMAWVDYGKRRISDLQSEHKHQCNQIVDIVNAFRDQKALMTREEIIKVISDNIVSRSKGGIIIDGKKTTSSMDIAAFLFRIGFIVARASDSDNYYHHFFENNPNLFSNRYQKDKDYLWEIHPCYRRALDIISLNAALKHLSPRKN